MSLLDRLRRGFSAMRADHSERASARHANRSGRRKWRLGEDVLLYRSEEEDLNRLLDFEEALAAEWVSETGAENFARWQADEPRRRRERREELRQQKRTLGR